MVLEYLWFGRWGKKIIRWESAPDGRREYVFAPTGEVPDELGKKILDQLASDFRVVETPKEVPEESPLPEQKESDFSCSECGFKGKSKASLSAHIRYKHKENKHEVPA